MDAAGVRFRLLGPVEVWIAGQRAEAGTARQRHVLAALLIRANRFVAAERIVEQIWGDRQRPERPLNTVRTYVSLLRRVLREADGVQILRQAGGYLLAVDERAVDLHEFGRLLDLARDAPDADQAAALFEAALALWRGEPLAGLDTPWGDTVRRRLDVRRQTGRLDLIDVQLRRGRHAEVLAELSAQAAEHPLDERIAGQLMLALYRSGRQAQALAHYRQVHQALDDELGVQPGRALRAVQQRILAADPELRAPGDAGHRPVELLPSVQIRALTPDPVPASTPAPRPAPVSAPASPSKSPDAPAATPSIPAPIPRQLPTAPRWFVGRTPELTRLTTLLTLRPTPATTPVICALSGPAGIGKTWLALHWAHQHAADFPDGHLYVNLHGFDSSREPTAEQIAIRSCLDALGVAPAVVPTTLDAQIGLYRSLTADRSMLIILDDAPDSHHTDPLLPGSAHSMVLVTSRHPLPCLVARYGADALELSPLTPAEARTLLACYLGTDRTTAEPAAVTALVHHCAGVPLAISIVATRALAQPTLPLATLAAELRDTPVR